MVVVVVALVLVLYNSSTTKTTSDFRLSSLSQVESGKVACSVVLSSPLCHPLLKQMDRVELNLNLIQSNPLSGVYNIHVRLCL